MAYWAICALLFITISTSQGNLEEEFARSFLNSLLRLITPAKIKHVSHANSYEDISPDLNDKGFHMMNLIFKHNNILTMKAPRKITPGGIYQNNKPKAKKQASKISATKDKTRQYDSNFDTFFDELENYLVAQIKNILNSHNIKYECIGSKCGKDNSVSSQLDKDSTYSSYNKDRLEQRDKINMDVSNFNNFLGELGTYLNSLQNIENKKDVCFGIDCKNANKKNQLNNIVWKAKANSLELFNNEDNSKQSDKVSPEDSNFDNFLIELEIYLINQINKMQNRDYNKQICIGKDCIKDSENNNFINYQSETENKAIENISGEDRDKNKITITCIADDCQVADESLHVEFKLNDIGLLTAQPKKDSPKQDIDDSNGFLTCCQKCIKKDIVRTKYQDPSTEEETSCGCNALRNKRPETILDYFNNVDDREFSRCCKKCSRTRARTEAKEKSDENRDNSGDGWMYSVERCVNCAANKKSLYLG